MERRHSCRRAIPDGGKEAGNASTSLQDAAQGIDNSLAPLDDALAALTDLVDNPAENITPQLQTFSSDSGEVSCQGQQPGASSALRKELQAIREQF